MVIKELVAKLGLEVDEVGFEKAEELFHKLHHGAKAFGFAAVGALAIGAAAMAKMTADAAASAGKMAQEMGLDLQTMQELGFAFEASGGDAETLAHALQRLAKSGVKDLKGSVLELSERFHGMPDSASARAEKLRIAIEKFGRGAGPQMVPFLNKGKEAIGELMDEAEALGLVFSEEDVEAGKEFRHELHTIESAFKGLGFTIGKIVLPFFTKILQGFVHIILMLRKGGPELKNWALGLRVVAFILGGVLLTALSLNTAAVGAAIIEYAALAAAAIGAAISAAAAWAVAAAPVVLIAAAFTALLLIIEDIWTFLNGGDSLIGELLGRFVGLIAEFKKKGEKPWLVFVLEQAVQLIDSAIFAVGVLKTAIEAIPNIASKILASDPLMNAAVRVGASMMGFNGGAASPEAAATTAGSGTKVLAPQFRVDKIEVHAAPGMSAEEVAGHVVRKMDSHFDSKMREAVKAQ